MTRGEGNQIDALHATLQAFLERYERDHTEAKEDRTLMLSRLDAMEHLRSRIGGAVMVLGFLLTGATGFLVLFWKWVIAQVTGAAP